MADNAVEQILLEAGLRENEVRRMLTHPSHPEAIRFHGASDFQRREFLGDALLDLVVTRMLLRRFPSANEGELTRRRSALVGKNSLADAARRSGMDQLVRTQGHDLADARSDAILADAYEVFLSLLDDKISLDSIERWVETVLLDTDAGAGEGRHPKTIVKEWAEKRGQSFQYERVEETGPAHDPVYIVHLIIDSKVFEGTGSSVRDAETDAARAAAAQLESMP